MLADILFDAQAQIQHYQHAYPDLYAPFAHRLEALKNHLAEVGTALDRLPVAFADERHAEAA